MKTRFAALALLLASASGARAQSEKFTDFVTAASPLLTPLVTDYIPVVRAGVTYHVTGLQLAGGATVPVTNTGNNSIATITNPAGAANYNYNLPIGAGTAGQYLTSGGGGSSPMVWVNPPVTSVALALPAELTVSGSPVTTTGTLTGAWASAAQNKVLAAPSGSSGTPGFRLLVAGDLPAAVAYLNVSQSWTAGQATTPTAGGTQAAGGTFTPDFSASNSVTLTFGAGNLTIANPSPAAKAGEYYTIALTQDGVGSRTVTWGANFKWAGGSAPTLSTTASAKDVLGCWADTTSTINCTLAVKGAS